MSMILATDLDGTLLYPKRRLTVLTKANRDFLRDFTKKAGNEVVLVTGRNIKSLSTIEKKVGIKMTFIGCNGGYTLTPQGFINENPLPAQVALEIYAQMKGHYGINVWFLLDESKRNYAYTTTYPFLFMILARLFNALSFRLREQIVLSETKFIARLSKGDVYKLMPNFGLGKKGQTKAKEAFDPLVAKYGDKVTIALSGTALEITAKNTSKGAALLAYIESKGLTPEDVIVVGDSGNDLSLFELFPHSFAMANGDEWVKNRAAHIVERVSDISEYLNHPERMSHDVETFNKRQK